MSHNGTMSNQAFRAMSAWLRLRESLGDPRQRLINAGLTEGQIVLDYGCGVGSYTIPAAQIVGTHGRVYALDIHPLAIRAVEQRADKAQMANVETIQSDRETQLADASVDIVLLYDVLHTVPNKRALLFELHRILKPEGRLSVLPDHMTEDDLSAIMEAGGLFTMQTRHGKVLEFRKRMES